MTVSENDCRVCKTSLDCDSRPVERNGYEIWLCETCIRAVKNLPAHYLDECHYEWGLRTLAGRQVAVRSLGFECADCGEPATLEVQELGGAEEPWFWCGHCDIGG